MGAKAAEMAGGGHRLSLAILDSSYPLCKKQEFGANRLNVSKNKQKNKQHSVVMVEYGEKKAISRWNYEKKTHSHPDLSGTEELRLYDEIRHSVEIRPNLLHSHGHNFYHQLKLQNFEHMFLVTGRDRMKSRPILSFGLSAP